MFVRRPLIGLVLAALISLAGCGGDQPPTPTTAEPSTSPATPPATAPPPRPPPPRTAAPEEPERKRKDSDDRDPESPPASQREFERYCETHPDACAD